MRAGQRAEPVVEAKKAEGTAVLEAPEATRALNGSALVKLASGEEVLLFRDGAGLHAVSSTCTHMGGPLSWSAEEKLVACPVHGSRFNPDGTVARGPAAKPLKVWSVAEGDGRIFLSEKQAAGK